jgi:hypothetical protein
MGNIADEVRRVIQARILAGQLPRAGNHEMFGRKGDGLLCACCDEVITPQQIEYVAEFADSSALTLPLHAHCYRMWLEVSFSVGSAPREWLTDLSGTEPASSEQQYG